MPVRQARILHSRHMKHITLTPPSGVSAPYIGGFLQRRLLGGADTMGRCRGKAASMTVACGANLARVGSKRHADRRRTSH